MKATITKEEFEKLSDEFKSEYSASGDDYSLKVEGGEDTGALKRAKDYEVERRKKAETTLKDTKDELESKVTELEDIRKGAISKDDVDALEKSYKEKYEKREKELQEKIDNSENSLKGLLVDNVASGIASELSTVPDLLADQIRKRLTTEQVDGKTVTRVLDAEGKPSALSVDDLKKEILADKKYAPILIGSKASGSGAQGSEANGGAKKFSEMSEKERTDLYQSDKDAYRKLRDEEKGGDS